MLMVMSVVTAYLNNFEGRKEGEYGDADADLTLPLVADEGELSGHC